jgi:hypothetical protein
MRQDKSPPKLFDHVLQKESGNVFYLSTEKLFGRKSRPNIDKILHSAGSVIRLSVCFDKRKAEVKYSQDSSLPLISNHLKSLDSGTRMEIFSQESDEDALIRIEAMESLRSVLFKPGSRLTWGISDVKDYFTRYGALQELHFYFESKRPATHTPCEAIVTFKMPASANTCVESFQQMKHKLLFMVELLQPFGCGLQSVTQESRIGWPSPQEDSSNSDASSHRISNRKDISCPPLKRCIISKWSQYVECTKITDEPSFNLHLELMLWQSRKREEASNCSLQLKTGAVSIFRQRSTSLDAQTTMNGKHTFKESNKATKHNCTAELLLYSESAEAVSRTNYLLCGLLHTTSKKFMRNPEHDEKIGLQRSFLSSSYLSDGISADCDLIQESEDSSPSVLPLTGPKLLLVQNSPTIIHHTSCTDDPSYQEEPNTEAEGLLVGAASSSKCYRFSRRQPLITFFAFPDEALLCSSPDSSRIETLLNYSPRY